MTVEILDPIQNHAEPSATALVGGIIGDVQKLVEQQFRLTRQEIADDLRQGTAAALIFGIGAGVCFLGAGFLGLALIHLLHWGAAPPGTDPSWSPLWVCHAVVGALCSVTGVGLLCGGYLKFKSIDPRNKPATEARKENSKWATAPK